MMTFESTQILRGLKAALLALLKPQTMAYNYDLPEADHQNQNGPVSCEDDPFASGSD